VTPAISDCFTTDTDCSCAPVKDTSSIAYRPDQPLVTGDGLPLKPVVFKTSRKNRPFKQPDPAARIASHRAP